MVLSIKKFGSPFESVEISLLTLKLGGLTAFSKKLFIVAATSLSSEISLLPSNREILV